jgi:hypothetical protein
VYESTAIPGSDWVVESRGVFCGFGVGGGVDIRARNIKTQELVVIAEGYDVIYADVLLDQPNHVTIRLPNLIGVIPIRDAFGPVQVGYDYRPKNDPQSRAAYQRWYYDRSSPKNIQWYCQNVLAKMDKANRDMWNSILARERFPEGSGKAYCDQYLPDDLSH